jgi:hypothetical protein
MIWLLKQVKSVDDTNSKSEKTLQVQQVSRMFGSYDSFDDWISLISFKDMPSRFIFKNSDRMMDYRSIYLDFIPRCLTYL